MKCPFCDEGLLTPTFLSFDEYIFMCKRKAKKRRAKELDKQRAPKPEVSTSFEITSERCPSNLRNLTRSTNLNHTSSCVNSAGNFYTEARVGETLPQGLSSGAQFQAYPSHWALQRTPINKGDADISALASIERTTNIHPPDREPCELETELPSVPNGRVFSHNQESSDAAKFQRARDPSISTVPQAEQITPSATPSMLFEQRCDANALASPWAMNCPNPV